MLVCGEDLVPGEIATDDGHQRALGLKGEELIGQVLPSKLLPSFGELD